MTWDMRIQNAIVHLIEKKAHTTDAHPTLREAEWELSPQVEKLLDEVRSVYNTRSGRGYGKFTPKGHVEALLKDLRIGEITFVEFTEHCMVDLTSRIRSQPLATGGYVLFAMYEHQQAEYLIIVMLKSKPGMTFDEALELASVNHLDMDRLHFAARVDLTKWCDASGERYISFAKGRAAEVADYFTAFMGVDEVEKSSETTALLVGAVADYLKDVMELDPDEVESEKSRAYTYCADKMRKKSPLYLEEFSAFLDEDNPERFLQFANNREISNEIDLHRGSLRALRRYRGKDRDVTVDFDVTVLNTRVLPDLERDELTIKGIPDDLRAQLEEPG